jgi:signal transduction histidine kinase
MQFQDYKIKIDTFYNTLGIVSKKLLVNILDNKNAFLRTWIPYLIFIFLNIKLPQSGIPGIIIVLILDILTGIYIYIQNMERSGIIAVIQNIKNGNIKEKVEMSKLHADNITLAEAVNSIGEGIQRAVETSMKDEKLKADLITNVSHDLKTPLTSIINYVALIKRENIDNPRIIEYVEVLDNKAYKLKQLTEDLLEASKISSGNVSVELTRINFVEFMNQTIGEFYEKFEGKDLQIIFKTERNQIMIDADPSHLWRVVENLFNNIYKYALAGTRVYADLRIKEENKGQKAVLLIKNISAAELMVDADDLTERFIRGDESRTTEGTGLGLSIAKNLTILQGGDFKIRLEGDLFKVTIEFPVKAVD